MQISIISLGAAVVKAAATPSRKQLEHHDVDVRDGTISEDMSSERLQGFRGSTRGLFDQIINSGDADGSRSANVGGVSNSAGFNVGTGLGSKTGANVGGANIGNEVSGGFGVNAGTGVDGISKTTGFNIGTGVGGNVGANAGGASNAAGVNVGSGVSGGVNVGFEISGNAGGISNSAGFSIGSGVGGNVGGGTGVNI